MSKDSDLKCTVEFYQQRLAEPWLLDSAVRLSVEANETPLAVPVGKLRRGGDIEFLDRREAERAMKALKAKRGFPGVRVIDYYLEKQKKPDYFELRWGDPPPFDGCDYSEPLCALMLGLHYGYSDDAIARLVLQYMEEPRRSFTKKQTLQIIQSARNPR